MVSGCGVIDVGKLERNLGGSQVKNSYSSGYVPRRARSWTQKSTIEYNPSQFSTNGLERIKGKLNSRRIEYKTRYNGKTRRLNTTRKVLRKKSRRGTRRRLRLKKRRR